MAKRKPLVFIAGEIVESKSSDTIDGNNITVTASGSTAERLLKDRFNDIINVKDYGAKGNGITDDTAAFQAAVSMAEQKNSVIYVPYGVYNISEPIEGEFISFGHPLITGNGSVTFLLDLYDDLVHKTKNVNETITGDKTFTGKTTFNNNVKISGNEELNGNLIIRGNETATGNKTLNGNEIINGNETINGNLTVTGNTVNEGNETHGKASGTTLTYNGTEIHNGAETHNGPVTFTDEINLSNEATAALTEDLLAAENNGFVDPTTLNGKLRIDPNEFIAANGGLSVSSANNINKLKVDLSNANKALLGNITPNIIKNGSGLSVDSATNKLKVDFQDITIDQLTPLVDPNGGIVVNDDQTDTDGYGKLKINFQDLTVDQITPLCDPEGGIVVNNDQRTIGYGKLKIDFSTMSMDRFSELLDQLNLPYIVGETISGQTVPKVFYVNPVTGQNKEKEIEILNEGQSNEQKVIHFYGWSQQYPWKTIAYATSKLASKYNISSNDVTLKVSAPINYEFTDTVNCAQQTRTTGYINIVPLTKDDKIILHKSTATGGSCINHTGGVWHFYNVTLKHTLLPQTRGSGSHSRLITSSSPEAISLHNCEYIIEDNTLARSTNISENVKAGGIEVRGIYAAGGNINIYGNNASIMEEPAILVPDLLTPRLSLLAKNSVLKAGSMLNGYTLSADTTLPDSHYIKRQTILVEGSLIKTGSILLANSIINGTTYNVSTTLDTDITIAEGSTGTIQDIPLTPPVDKTTWQVNYRNRYYGYKRTCSFGAGSVIKVGSIIDGEEVTGSDQTFGSRKVVTSFTLAPGSIIAADSFLIPARLNYGPIINGEAVTDATAGWTTEAITITSDTTTTFEGSDATNWTWFYADDSGIINFVKCNNNNSGVNYGNYAFNVEGRFDYFYEFLYKAQLMTHGDGLMWFFLYDPKKISGRKYSIRSGGSLANSASDYIDRETAIPGHLAGTVNYNQASWLSPSNPS